MGQQAAYGVGQGPRPQRGMQGFEGIQGLRAQRLDVFGPWRICPDVRQTRLNPNLHLVKVPSTLGQALRDSWSQLPKLGGMGRAGNRQRDLLSVYAGHPAYLSQRGRKYGAGRLFDGQQHAGGCQYAGGVLVAAQPPYRRKIGVGGGFFARLALAGRGMHL